MASSSSESTFSYRPHPLAPLPKTLDPAYYDSSPERRRAEAERQHIRARLKREYLLQLNDPRRKHPIEDPAMTQWVYAKTNVYPNVRMNPKTSFLGFVHFLLPVVCLTLLFKKQKDCQPLVGKFLSDFSKI